MQRGRTHTNMHSPHLSHNIMDYAANHTSVIIFTYDIQHVLTEHVAISK